MQHIQFISHDIFKRVDGPTGMNLDKVDTNANPISHKLTSIKLILTNFCNIPKGA
jgi:hypothetical protein